MNIEYRLGVPEVFRDKACQLYDQAFGQKFNLAINDANDRLNLFQKCFRLDFAFCAIANEQLVGLAGFHAIKGSLTGGISFEDLQRQLGFWRACRAAIVFSLYERKLKANELLMDGIAVDEEVRGKGVGSRLLSEIQNYSKSNGYESVRLDVIDTNPKAKKLYERMGFLASKNESFEFLKPLLGFGGVTTMTFKNKC